MNDTEPRAVVVLTALRREEALLMSEGAIAMNWDNATPLERDAWIAEHVMGWSLTIDDGIPAHDRWYDRKTWELHGTVEDHKFTTDAASDYSVLERVRETWDAQKQTVFCERLAGMGGVQYHRMPRVLSGGEGCEWCCLQYRPGDYSHAAYLTLTEAT